MKKHFGLFLSVIFVVLALFIFIPQALAQTNSHWGFGALLGGGIESRGDNDVFGHLSVVTTYRFDIPLSLRISAGGLYVNNPNERHTWGHAGLSALWHIASLNKAFNPYLIGGIETVPIPFDGDLHMGAGNEFALTEKTCLFVEAVFGTNYLFLFNSADDVRHHGRLSAGFLFRL